jgi:hypothetical protein
MEYIEHSRSTTGPTVESRPSTGAYLRLLPATTTYDYIYDHLQLPTTTHYDARRAQANGSARRTYGHLFSMHVSARTHRDMHRTASSVVQRTHSTPRRARRRRGGATWQAALRHSDSKISALQSNRVHDGFSIFSHTGFWEFSELESHPHFDCKTHHALLGLHKPDIRLKYTSLKGCVGDYAHIL